jgi:hypothetical protein
MDIHAPLLLFQTRTLEDRFRNSMTSKHEIGGWLICSSWRGLTHDTRVREIFGTWAMTVFAWIIVPNESRQPWREWWSSKLLLSQQIAGASASSMGMSVLHFHTHPTGSPNDPSVADGKFAITHCAMGRDKGESVVVQTSPLRVNYFFFEEKRGRNRTTIYHTKGQFLSWRSPKMQQILKD